jgi:hypothetical protein
MRRRLDNASISEIRSSMLIETGVHGAFNHGLW